MPGNKEKKNKKGILKRKPHDSCKRGGGEDKEEKNGIFPGTKHQMSCRPQKKQGGGLGKCPLVKKGKESREGE